MAVSTAYQSPKYIPHPEDGWYHVLYGHVPGYQLDFIYRPQLPFQKLKLQHFSDLQIVIRHLRPLPQSPLAFAICNLSAHDTQHRPGHGALAIAAAVRLQQASDHAGRVSPVFTHAAVLVDQSVAAETLCVAAEQFIQRFRKLGPTWYQGYYDENRPLDTLSQAEYVQHFADLPQVAADSARLRWKPRAEGAVPSRVTILCPEISPLKYIVAAASRIATILYYSRVRWLSIGNGDPQALEQMYAGNSTPELSVRFAHATEPGTALPQSGIFLLEDLPSDEQSLAALLGLVPAIRPTTTTQQEELPSAAPIAEAAALFLESRSEEKATESPEVPAAIGTGTPESPSSILDKKEEAPAVASHNRGDMTLILPQFRAIPSVCAPAPAPPQQPASSVSTLPPPQKRASSKLGWLSACVASAVLGVVGVRIYLRSENPSPPVSPVSAPKEPSIAASAPPMAPVGSAKKQSKGGAKKNAAVKEGATAKAAASQKAMTGPPPPVVPKVQPEKQASPVAKPVVTQPPKALSKPTPSAVPAEAKSQPAQKGLSGSKPASGKTTTEQKPADAQGLSPEAARELKAAKKAIDHCNNQCEVNPPSAACLGAVKRVEDQLADHKDASRIRLEISENLCRVCREAIPSYCLKKK